MTTSTTGWGRRRATSRFPQTTTGELRATNWRGGETRPTQGVPNKPVLSTAPASPNHHAPGPLLRQVGQPSNHFDGPAHAPHIALNPPRA